jgi:hypothetical protein
METITLLIKKIAVGVLVFAIPLGIYYGGLWLVRHVL